MPVIDAYEILKQDFGPVKELNVREFLSLREEKIDSRQVRTSIREYAVVIQFVSNKELSIAIEFNDDLSRGYDVVVSYLKKFRYYDAQCNIQHEGFHRTTHDLKRDLGLFKTNSPMSEPIDLNAEADKEGLSRTLALRAIKRMAAEEALKTRTRIPARKPPTPKARPRAATKKIEPTDDFKAKLKAAEEAVCGTTPAERTIRRGLQRHREDRQKLPLPRRGYRTEEQALAATRLANNFTNLQKRLQAAGFEPLPPDDRVLAAQRLSRAFFRTARV